MISLLISWAVLAGSVLLTSIILKPGIRIKGWPTAFVVAAVFGILHTLLFKLMIFLSLPLVIITFGLFTFVLNAILLWITDQAIEEFEIKSFGWTIAASLLITLFSRVGSYILGV